MEWNRHFWKNAAISTKKRPSRLTAKPLGKGFFELLRKPLGSRLCISIKQKSVLDETDINDVETF